MKAKTVCGYSVLGFLLALIVQATCFKLTSLKVDPAVLANDHTMAIESNSTIKLSKPPTTEVFPSKSTQSQTNLSTNANVTMPYTVNTTIPECDRSRRTGIVIMISFNHFGFMKSNHLMHASLDIMKKLQNEGSLVRLVIDDLVPKEDDPSSLDQKGWILTSMIRKLQYDTFSPIRSWELNVFGFLFVDKTVDFSDPVLMREMRRINFQDILFYMIIIGEGVDMDVINKYQLTPDQVINISSYDTLHSSLPSKLIEKLCVRPSKSKIGLA